MLRWRQNETNLRSDAGGMARGEEERVGHGGNEGDGEISAEEERSGKVYTPSAH